MRLVSLTIGLLALILLLYWRFPYAAQAPGDKAQLLYSSIFAILIGSSAFALRTSRGYTNVTNMFKYAAIWLVIIVLLVLGYSFRGQLTYNRIMAELLPQQAQTTAEGYLTVQRSEDGHFHIEALVNGVLVPFMVDTGASDIVLSPRDAARAGYAIDSLNYSRATLTANGVGSGAPVRIDSLEIGGIHLEHLEASVNRAEMSESLLGMRFLNELKEYSVTSNTLTLKP